MTIRQFREWNMAEWLLKYHKKPVKIARLAIVVGCSKTHLGQVIRGERNTTRKFLERIATALNVPLPGGAGWFWFPVPEQLVGKGVLKDG